VGTRPLRQYYEPVGVELDAALRAPVEPWARHRRRLLDALGALDEEQWKRTTRCTAWDARGVVGHLIVVDGFWTTTMAAAQRGDEPTRFIEGFDPSSGTDAFVAPMLDQSPEALLDRLAGMTDALVTLVESIDGDQWDALGEAPFGHMPAHLLLAHAYWDSWLHERDILEPLGLATPVDADDLRNATVYTFVVGGLQGGLLGDPTPNGPGPDAPVEATVSFADLRLALHVRYDDAVHFSVGNPAGASPAGEALALVEGIAGRGPSLPAGALPPDLDAQLARAAQIL
jgi:uncharacterized protein (TIGR03083 family)